MKFLTAKKITAGKKETYVGNNRTRGALDLEQWSIVLETMERNLTISMGRIQLTN